MITYDEYKSNIYQILEEFFRNKNDEIAIKGNFQRMKEYFMKRGMGDKIDWSP